ncbi:hypothetical protein CHGG_09885 [Chaetomium globosum CBS 148.51]|uniref:Long-chain-alcohol oxidase n=1 Tax=Chaetomium globosum (strain ATCC 6205 / CBS 148.51 / DSM 1962 / NBRC 6347 / NRRL 1970) TaxID=306901 RepID=Q2GQ69_CHAGB|nr:uncharacterized protein CHGG_09885 [Chaetomium globosum CBS 148.51]EAQ83481.1 hypothetical protein CHGG_09885 [Chaetomium globosum CBS 148.51]
MATTTETAPLSAPVHVELPDALDIFNETQWKVLMALMDAVIPAIRIQESGENTKGQDTSIIHLPSSEYSDAAVQLRNAASPGNPTPETLEAYLAERPSDNPAFAQVLKCVLSNVPPNKQRELRILLSILNTRPGSLILTSHATPFPSLPLQDRMKILQNWSTSSLWSLRTLFKSMSTLAKLAHIRSSTAFPLLTGFPAVPSGWTAGTTSYPYEFLQFHPTTSTTNPPNQPLEITTDVAILGSGCGAGVVANRLAREFGPSLQVLVLEKGRHLDARHFPLSQAGGLASLFEAGGVVESDDGSVTVTAGSCFGGGGTVNWSASLMPQGFVREEWVRERGLGFFGGEEFQGCLDGVWEKMGCSGERVRPNHANRVLVEGAERLGYQAKVVPQNVGGTEHYCGYCTLGCWKGEKKGPVNGWFPEAAKQGVKFVEGMQVERVIFEEGKKGKVAKGVKGVWTSREGEKVQVVVKAKKVVVSCGTLWSPVVLMNSGIKDGSLTSVVGSFENLDSKGHGVKLEAMSHDALFCLPFLPWASGLEYKLLSAKYRHLNTFIAICRDRDTGSIYRDPTTGRPRITYTPSDFDRAHNMRGVLELCRILYGHSAREIHPSIADFAPFIRKEGADAEAEKKEFEAWLAKLKAHGNKPPVSPFASAHQMGTCRMSAKPKEGVVDSRGRVWGTQGLYVADASVFPSASGVNPMVTTMAIADWIGKGVCEDLRGEGFAARL